MKKIDKLGFDAVIFDMNGTILSDEDEYGQAFKKVLLSLGIKNDSDYPHKSGIGVDENWEIFKNKYKLETEKTVGELATMTQNEYLKILREVELKPGFLEFVNSIRKSGIQTALATSNSYSITERVLEKFQIKNLFDVVTTREEVKINKPDPEIFLITAQKLMVDPSRCVVFEDSPAGVEAAKSAGMKVVGIARSEAYKKKLKRADLVVFDFQEFLGIKTN